MCPPYTSEKYMFVQKNPVIKLLTPLFLQTAPRWWRSHQVLTILHCLPSMRPSQEGSSEPGGPGSGLLFPKCSCHLVRRDGHRS